ncbi:MAG: peptidoglycan bridge formation glycyltransferase FemA/FemB family protein [bacterium]|nr:peptidoglycan bridge formation glycyltransferase FemA/FemB family protein [bacterium]
MKIIALTETEFDKFASNHKYRNFYQTSNYAKVMKVEGFESAYLGFYNNSNDLIGASLILHKKVWLNYKIAYAPFGFLIDYSNNDLIEEMTYKLKKLLLKQRFIYLKINPLIHCAERKKNGDIISYNPEINDILEILKRNHYRHHGFNKFFENQKPRWTAITKLTISNNKIYQLLSKQVRNKINKANRNGVDIYKATHEDLTILYEFIKRKQKKSINYYQALLDAFQEKAEIYLAYINPEKYVRLSKAYYEQELEKNEAFNDTLQERTRKGQDVSKLINTKMESDKKLGIYQASLMKATTIFQEHPKGIIIGGALIIKYTNGANLIIEGFDKNYQDYNPNYLLKWELIKKFNDENYQYFNLNGIVGEFNQKNKYSGLNEMKLGFNASAIEYIGEFDLIINKTVYNILHRNRII